MSIARLTVVRYKAFSRFTVPLHNRVVFVGPNNAGKSSLISALRTISLMLRIARRALPTELRETGGETRRVYPFPRSLLAREDDNVHFNLESTEARIVAEFANGGHAHAVWPADPEEEPYFYLTGQSGISPRNVAEIRKGFRTIGVVPTLTPLDHNESLLSAEHVRRHLGTRMSSRHFRNQLHLMASNPGSEETSFDQFAALVRRWLPETSVAPPQLRYGRDAPEIDVYFRDGPEHREICWAGDGFQIFLQLLLYVSRYAARVGALVLDEPDVFLHPDLQRRLLRVVYDLDCQVLIATHSPEIVIEAPPSDLAWIDKSRTRAVISTRGGAAMAQASATLGSAINLGMARVLRAKAAVFLPTSDMKVVKQLMSLVGVGELDFERSVAVVPYAPAPFPDLLVALKWLSSSFASAGTPCYAVLGHSYLDDEVVRAGAAQLQLDMITPVVWESYSLISHFITTGGISRATGLPLAQCTKRLSAALKSVRSASLAAMVAERMAIVLPEPLDYVDVLARCDREMDKWQLRGELNIRIRPQDILRVLSRDIVTLGPGVLTESAIILSIRRVDIPNGVGHFVREMKAVCQEA